MPIDPYRSHTPGTWPYTATRSEDVTFGEPLQFLPIALISRTSGDVELVWTDGSSCVLRLLAGQPLAVRVIQVNDPGGSTASGIVAVR